MILRWYAGINYGLEKLAAGIVRDGGGTDIRIYDGAVTFSRRNAPELLCATNLFLILAEFKSSGMADAAAKMPRLRYDLPGYASGIIRGKTFRIVTMDCGKLRPVPDELLRAAERSFSGRMRIKAERSSPGVEIWVNRRGNGETFLMLRVTKRRDFARTLKQGELRPDVAHIMLYAAGTRKNGVIADPFGGWGAISSAALDAGGYAQIHTGDMNGKCVEHQKRRFKGRNGVTVRQWDALTLPLPDSSADAVVTDPPWGVYERVDVERLYGGFIKEAARVLKPGGALVFLSSAEAASKKALETHGLEYSCAPLKINGRETVLFRAAKVL